MSSGIQITNGVLTVTKDGRVVVSLDRSLMNLVPQATISLSAKAISFPDLLKGTIYHKYRYTPMFGADQFACASFTGLIEQEWGPAEAGGFNLADEVLGTVPAGTDYLDVMVNLTNTQVPGGWFGEDGFGALARAASNALDEIANKATQQLASGLWDMIFGAIGGGGGSWTIPNVFKPGGFFPGLATGGTVTQGGWTMVGERGPELLNLPSGSKVMNNQVSAQALAGAGAGGGTIVQIIDQRRGGKAVRQEEGRGPNGEKIIRAIIEDEIREGVRRGKYEF